MQQPVAQLLGFGGAPPNRREVYLASVIYDGRAAYAMPCGTAETDHVLGAPREPQVR